MCITDLNEPVKRRTREMRRDVGKLREIVTIYPEGFIGLRLHGTRQEETIRFRLSMNARYVKEKYGEPENWDGLSALFVILMAQFPEAATSSEREWLRALKSNTADSK
jgi:hypothetical protein